MALQVWLPLNKDFRNTGLLPNFPNPSYNNFMINSNGQFINCHKGSAVFHFQNDFLNTNKWSIAIWFNKPTAYPSQANAILLCKNTSTSTDCQFYFSVVYGTRLNIGIGTTSSLMYENTFDINTWYHAAATYDGETLKLYLNGELVNSKKMSYTPTERLNLGIGGRSTNTGGTTAYGDDYLINDARIYDNTLTEKDIKKIYQQKVFEFYPKENRKNYLSYANVNGAFGWSSYGFGSKGIGEVTNEVVAAYTTNSQNIRNGNTDNVIKITTSYSGNSTSPSEMARWVDCIPIADNECVTFSFYAKGDGTSVGRIIRVHVYGTKSGDSSTNLSTGSDYRLTSNWKRYSHVFKWDKGGTSTGRYSCYMAPYIAKDEHVYVCNFQLEEGSGTTTYNNASARDLMFDKAGFSLKNDLVCSGVTFSGNTAIFNGTSDIIKSKTAGLSISGGTLSIWFFIETKPSTTQLIYLDGNNRMAFGLYNNASVIIVSTKISSPTYPASSVVYGSWNHVAITYGTNYVATNCYLNCVKLTSSGSDSWSNGNSFLEIGGRVYYSQYFKGSIKNIKIFKKQLSEEEILELYRQNGN